MEAVIFSFVRDEGSVVVFAATRVDTGQDVYIGVAHRMAEVLVRALDFEDPLVEIEDWQIIGNVPVPPGLNRYRNAEA